jgi:hypothetical protein
MPDIKYNMTTFDEVVSQSTIDFMAKAKSHNKPFFRLDEHHARPRTHPPLASI